MTQILLTHILRMGQTEFHVTREHSILLSCGQLILLIMLQICLLVSRFDVVYSKA